MSQYSFFVIRLLFPHPSAIARAQRLALEIHVRCRGRSTFAQAVGIRAGGGTYCAVWRKARKVRATLIALEGGEPALGAAYSAIKTEWGPGPNQFFFRLAVNLHACRLA